MQFLSNANLISGCILVFVAITSSCGPSEGKNNKAPLTGEAPKIELEYPRPNETVVGMTTLKVWVEAPNDVSTIEFDANGVALSTMALGDQVFAWDASDLNEGTYTLTAKVTANGGKATTANHEIHVVHSDSNDALPPVTSVGYPREGDEISGLQYIRAAGTDNDSVDYIDLYIDGLLATRFVDQYPLQFLLDTREFNNGQVTLQTRAYDDAGNSTISEIVNVLVQNDTVVAPVCGDGVLSVSEECDDGNGSNGDFCSSTCFWEQDNFELDNTYRAARSIQPNQLVVDHSISGFTDVDYFKFTSQGADAIVLQTSAEILCGDEEGLADTLITLFSDDGLTELSMNDDGGRYNLCSEIVWREAEPGDYFAKVQSWGKSVGHYQLSFMEVNDDIYAGNFDRNRAADIGAPPLAISNLVDMDQGDWFRSHVLSGEQYRVAIVDANCQSDDRSALEVSVYEEDKVTLIGSDREYATEECASVEFTADYDGDVYIAIDQMNAVRWGETYGLQISQP